MLFPNTKIRLLCHRNNVELGPTVKVYMRSTCVPHWTLVLCIYDSWKQGRLLLVVSKLLLNPTVSHDCTAYTRSLFYAQRSSVTVCVFTSHQVFTNYVCI